MTDLKTLYDEDIVAWSKQQAEALRAAARTGSNQLLDWENLAEEIEDLGKSLRISLRSQLSRIIQHQVKLAFSPASDPRKGWRRTIRQARAEIERVLKDSPSLRRELLNLVDDETQRSIDLAIRDLEEYDELSRLDLPSLRRAGYTLDQVLGDWFPPDPEEPPRRAEEP
jgi:Domain of unknown function DUF29